MARGSRLTAECRLRKLGRFCELHDMTPMELESQGMKDLRTATDLLEADRRTMSRCWSRRAIRQERWTTS